MKKTYLFLLEDKKTGKRSIQVINIKGEDSNISIAKNKIKKHLIENKTFLEEFTRSEIKRFLTYSLGKYPLTFSSSKEDSTLGIWAGFIRNKPQNKIVMVPHKGESKISAQKTLQKKYSKDNVIFVDKIETILSAFLEMPRKKEQLDYVAKYKK